MQLLTQELRKKLPALGATEKIDDPTIQAKFFTPDSNWTWFATEFDQKDTFFGAVSGFEFELGYFSLSELQQTRGPLGLPIERDLHFTPTPLSKIRKEYERRGRKQAVRDCREKHRRNVLLRRKRRLVYQGRRNRFYRPL